MLGRGGSLTASTPAFARSNNTANPTAAAASAATAVAAGKQPPRSGAAAAAAKPFSPPIFSALGPSPPPYSAVPALNATRTQAPPSWGAPAATVTAAATPAAFHFSTPFPAAGGGSSSGLAAFSGGSGGPANSMACGRGDGGDGAEGSGWDSGRTDMRPRRRALRTLRKHILDQIQRQGQVDTVLLLNRFF